VNIPIFAYSIDVNPNERTLVLADDNNIRILAISVARENPELMPACVDAEKVVRLLSINRTLSRANHLRAYTNRAVVWVKLIDILSRQ
jgi:hypothetical protein